MTRRRFNNRFRRLEIGFFSKTKSGLSKLISVDRPGGKPNKKYYKDPGVVQITPPKIVYMRKGMDQILKKAPIGSFVTWTNQDAVNKCSKNSRLSFCVFRHENTIKIGADKFVAHPFGVLSENEIKNKMAIVVVGNKSQSYIARNIFISQIRYPK